MQFIGILTQHLQSYRDPNMFYIRKLIQNSAYVHIACHEPEGDLYCGPFC